MPLTVNILTMAGQIFTGTADEVTATAQEDGQFGILPGHAPLISLLDIGPLHIKRQSHEDLIFVGGGFLEVLNDTITVLADDAEHAENIDEAKAEDARRRAQIDKENATEDIDIAIFQAEIERSAGRIRVAEMYRVRSRRRTSSDE